VSSHCGRGCLPPLSEVSFIRAIIPLMRAEPHDLITSQRLHPPNAIIILGIRITAYAFGAGVDKHSDHSKNQWGLSYII
jgi:hypothetical protein